MRDISDNMICVYFFRLALAGMHFNENSNRKQAVTQGGKERWEISYPKYKSGAVAKTVKKEPTYGKIVS